MTAEQERAIWAFLFLTWCRDQGYALCAAARWSMAASTSTTLELEEDRVMTAWVPVPESGGTLIERFGASRAHQDANEEQTERQEGRP